MGRRNRGRLIFAEVPSLQGSSQTTASLTQFASLPVRPCLLVPAISIPSLWPRDPSCCHLLICSSSKRNRRASLESPVRVLTALLVAYRRC